MKKRTTETIVLMGVFVALSIVLTRILVYNPTNSIRITLGSFPIVLASLLFGPIAGMMVGGVADVLGCITLSPQGWDPFLTISPIITGAIPWLFKKWIIKDKKLYKYIIVVLIAHIPSSMIWTTYWLSYKYGLPFLFTLSTRIPVNIGISIIEAFILYLMFKSKPLSKFLKF